MKTFEFKSAICTSREQSERLLALGLKKETADMHHYRWSEGYWDIQACPPRGDSPSYIPAWSLARLFEISNSATHIGLPAMIDRQQPYDYLIATIKDYIKYDCFNKNYLEEKK